MFSREIVCNACNLEGVIEAHDTLMYPKGEVFTLLGKDDSGYLHFRCPSCESDVAVDPIAAMGSEKLAGLTPGQLLYRRVGEDVGTTGNPVGTLRWTADMLEAATEPEPASGSPFKLLGCFGLVLLAVILLGHC